MLNKLKGIEDSKKELKKELVSPMGMVDMKQYVSLNKEYLDLKAMVEVHYIHRNVVDNSCYPCIEEYLTGITEKLEFSPAHSVIYVTVTISKTGYITQIFHDVEFTEAKALPRAAGYASLRRICNPLSPHCRFLIR